MEKPPVILWFRQDLRLSDNPALYHAASSPILPLFIWDEQNPYNPGRASQWWLYHSLISLKRDLKLAGLTLIFRRGDPFQILQEIISHHGVKALYWNRCYDPYSRGRDKKIKEFFSAHIKCESFNGSLLSEPWEIKTGLNTPYRVFTPYWNSFKQKAGGFSPPLPVPGSLSGHKALVDTDDLKSWNLCPTLPDWAKGFAEGWMPGELGAQQRLYNFLSVSLENYHENRDYPGKDATSKLSPHIHWGEISSRQIWFATQATKSSVDIEDVSCFLKELCWREFSYYLLYHFPDLPHHSFKKIFDDFPWESNSEVLKAWQKGKTGYPIIDAGMRELWQTGYMHNRVRMIVASFLVKNLQVDWREGEKWFWDCLVDGDLASNSVNWQWVAGSGVDAAPYFRVFNPITQAEKFDPGGNYIRRFVPEIALLPNTYLFKPWTASESVLKKAGVSLGMTYPKPIVDLAVSRKRALQAFASLPKAPYS